MVSGLARSLGFRGLESSESLESLEGLRSSEGLGFSGLGFGALGRKPETLQTLNSKP